jgi:hypothetical protein
MDLIIHPTHPWQPGDEPTHVEYEALKPGSTPACVTAAVGEHAHIVEDAPFRIRYRYVWDGRPGAWNDEGVPWEKP